MSEYFLEARNIYKSFGGVHALKGVNLKIRYGETLCLAGENGCGKSTMIKIISGAYTMDSGEICIDGTKYSHITPLQSTHAGIQVIYQDFSLFHNLTAAENIAMAYNLGTERKGAFSKKRNREIAEKILREIGVEIDPDEIVDDLPIAQRQIVAICRALVQDAKLIIMDEPTTALTNKEVKKLFHIIRDLKEKGISLIFVSHKLDEVMKIADRVMIMRNGENIIDGPVEEFDASKITFYMTGREIERTPFPNEIDTEQEIFSCDALTSRSGRFQDISFKLYKGEVLGITGLLGSGRESLAEALFGLHRCGSGEIYLNGKKLKLKSSMDAVAEGIGYIPEDRATQGLYLKGSIRENIYSTVMFRHETANFLHRKELYEIAEEEAKNMAVKCGSIDDAANSLSGGNQQRVVIAKWLALNPKLLILNCPTVGVDVGSKAEIHTLARKFAAEGIGVIIISDDLPELFSSCNRILVMNHGEITGSFRIDEITEEELSDRLGKN